MRFAALVAALSVLAASSNALAAPGKVPTRLLDEARRAGKVRVIAELEETAVVEGSLPRRAVTRQRARIAAATRRVESVLAGSNGRVTRAFGTIPFVALEVDAAGLEALSRSADVKDVAADELSFVSLAQSGPIVEADEAHEDGFDGEGQTIAILDTGVDADHPFLEGRVVAEACFSALGDCPNGSTSQLGPGSGAPCAYAPESCAHGTHVAGIVAGSGASFDGVAPAADVIAIQVFSRFEGSFCDGAGEDPCAASFSSDHVAALERVLELAESHEIAAVNMSIGGVDPFTSTAACDAANAARKAAMDNLRSEGIATVVASGNESFTNALSSPACISSAVSVGATTDGDQVAGFSNSASFLSLLAPGVGITSSEPGGVFVSMSGTSMAAPHVAGAFALLRQQRPTDGVDETLERLQETGFPVTDARNGVTTSRIRLALALDVGAASSPGLLENPPDGSAASGIGAFTGWICDADEVLIRIDEDDTFAAAYGTSRGDTLAVCGDTDNGFSLLYNFNLAGDGEHVVELIADGVVLSRNTFTVATFGVSFLSGAPAESYVLPDFHGHDVTVTWQ